MMSHYDYDESYELLYDAFAAMFPPLDAYHDAPNPKS